VDYLKHLLIRTPLYRPFTRIRYLLSFWKRAKHPELIGIYEEPFHVEAMMRKAIRKDSNCVDVGSHLGSVLNEFVTLAPRGRHYAFEAVPRKAEWLLRKFPEATILNVALSDTSGTTAFYENTDRSGFSGLQPHSLGSDEGFKEHRIECKRLDEVLPPDYVVHFLKVDVEGAELKVLHGATDVLKRDKPFILFECTQSGLCLHAVPPGEIYLFFRDTLGYDVFIIKDWLSGGAPLTRGGFVDAMTYPFAAFNFLAVPRATAPDR
jgi:FkbM family methyltransferase